MMVVMQYVDNMLDLVIVVVVMPYVDAMAYVVDKMKLNTE